MSRNDQVTRILKILQILEAYPRGLAIREIHTKLTEYTSVTERTARRDLDALIEAGFAFEENLSSDKNEAKKFKLQNAVHAGKNLVLSPRELLTLYLAKGALNALAGSALFSDLKKVFIKIDDLIQPRGRLALDEIAADFKFSPSPLSSVVTHPNALDAPEVIETIRAACAEKQVLKGVYRSGNKEKPQLRSLGPQFFYLAKGSLYLVAEDLDTQSIKVYAVSRFSKVEMTEEPYQGADLDPETYFAGSFGVFQSDGPVDIRIEVRPPLATFIQERSWHPSQTVTELKSGAIELRLKVGVTPDLIHWILGLGENAVVTSPASLRKQILDAAQAIATHYQSRALKLVA